MISIVDYLREKGRLQSEEARAVARGKSSYILNQLMHKFGAVPALYHFKVLIANDVQIQSWSLRLLSASTIEEIFEVEVTD